MPELGEPINPAFDERVEHYYCLPAIYMRAMIPQTNFHFTLLL